MPAYGGLAGGGPLGLDDFRGDLDRADNAVDVGPGEDRAVVHAQGVGLKNSYIAFSLKRLVTKSAMSSRAKVTSEWTLTWMEEWPWKKSEQGCIEM